MVVGKSPLLSGSLEGARALHVEQGWLMGAGLADGGRSGRWGAGKRENMECGAAWQRLQDAPSAPCFCLRPL